MRYSCFHQQHVGIALKEYSNLPIAVGLGIQNAATAAAVSAMSDAVIIRSVLVRTIEKNPDNDGTIIANISELLADMRQAMDEIV